MELKREQIKNGIFLNYVKETRFKTNCILINFIMPLKKETISNNALVFQVINRGTEKYPKMIDIKRACEDNYDTNINVYVSKRGDNQELCLSCGVLDKKYTFDNHDTTSCAFDMLDQFINHPYLIDGTFKKEYVKSVKEKAIDAEKSIINNKRQYASIQNLKLMFENDVYALQPTGNIELIEKCDEKTIYSAYQKILKSALVEIFAVGNFDFDEIKDKCVSLFKNVERSNRIHKYKSSKMKIDDNQEIKKVYEKMDVTQGKLSLGFYTGICENDEEFYAFRMFNSIYGGGSTNKLFANVREKMSLCYYCYSSDNNNKGYMQVNAGIEFENEEKAFKEIMRQLELIKKGKITNTEINNAKLEYANILNSIEDSNIGIAGWYYECILKGKNLTPEDVKEKYMKVTKEQIVEQAKKIKLITYYFLCGKEHK